MCRDKALSPALTAAQLPAAPHILSHPGLVFIKNSEPLVVFMMLGPMVPKQIWDFSPQGEPRALQISPPCSSLWRKEG